MLLLNYPSNPTGVCYTGEQLERLAKVCVDRDLWIVADEIYSELLYGDRRFTSIAAMTSSAKVRMKVG